MKKTYNLPTLEGSSKQIAWAEDIRNALIENVSKLRNGEGGCFTDDDSIVYNLCYIGGFYKKGFYRNVEKKYDEIEVPSSIAISKRGEYCTQQVAEEIAQAVEEFMAQESSAKWYIDHRQYI